MMKMFQYFFFVIFFLLERFSLSTSTIFYGVRTYERDEAPLYGSVFTLDTNSSAFRFFGNFSYHIDDKQTYLYFFETSPVAVVNETIYFAIQSGTAFQRLMLYSYNMLKKHGKQSPWTLNDGFIHSLHYDAKRNRLFGLRDYSTFTLFLEEYNLNNLSVVRQYTQQDGSVYAFPYEGCSIYDPEENWLLEVRTRFENPSVNAYFVKMDLNLIGNQSDLVVDFHLLPNIHNLLSMTYDLSSKTILVTWQHGSIELDIFMMYMNPYTSEFRNQTLLLEHRDGFDVESVEAVYHENIGEILFLILEQSEDGSVNEQWMILVEFQTMKIRQKTKIRQPPAINDWQFFLL